MEQGDWCSLRWVDSECTGSARIAVSTPLPRGHGVRPAGAERGKGWQPDTSVSLAVWKQTGLFVCKTII